MVIKIIRTAIMIITIWSFGPTFASDLSYTELTEKTPLVAKSSKKGRHKAFNTTPGQQDMEKSDRTVLTRGEVARLHAYWTTTRTIELPYPIELAEASLSTPKAQAILRTTYEDLLGRWAAPGRHMGCCTPLGWGGKTAICINDVDFSGEWRERYRQTSGCVRMFMICHIPFPPLLFVKPLLCGWVHSCGWQDEGYIENDKGPIFELFGWEIGHLSNVSMSYSIGNWEDSDMRIHLYAETQHERRALKIRWNPKDGITGTAIRGHQTWKLGTGTLSGIDPDGETKAVRRKIPCCEAMCPSYFSK